MDELERDLGEGKGPAATPPSKASSLIALIVGALVWLAFPLLALTGLTAYGIWLIGLIQNPPPGTDTVLDQGFRVLLLLFVGGVDLVCIGAFLKRIARAMNLKL